MEETKTMFINKTQSYIKIIAFYLSTYTTVRQKTLNDAQKKEQQGTELGK